MMDSCNTRFLPQTRESKDAPPFDAPPCTRQVFVRLSFAKKEGP